MTPDQADMLHVSSWIDIRWIGEINGQPIVRLICKQTEVLEVPATPVEPWIGEPAVVSPGMTEVYVVIPITPENVARLVQASMSGVVYATISD